MSGFRPRLWPHSMMGQMLLAVALALFLVQGLGAFLIYRAQAERREMGQVHALAFRLIGETRGADVARQMGGRDWGRNRDRGRDGDPHDGRGRDGRPFRIDRAESSPLRPDEHRNPQAEAQLNRILAEQGVATAEVVVAERRIEDDPTSLARAQRRARILPDKALAEKGYHPPDTVIVAGVRLKGEPGWLVARTRGPDPQWDLVKPLLLQTLVIYVVLVGAVALIMRRITRPLASLTRRLEHFGQTRDPDGQVEPQGPDDIRRLIHAHNTMESRISALLDEKDVMLGAIGHDLKTPLAALRVRIESVEDDTERARMAATIEDIVRSLDDILSLARVGRPSDALERTELSALVASVVEEYEDMGEPVELGDTRRIALDLRPTWLRRALRNLIGNAVRYGGVARVSLEPEAGYARVRIDDDGPGIPEDQIESMMEPFSRGDPSRNRGTGGAGLGLALARAIADQHGGSLELANRRGADGSVAGLTATLRLPLGG
ncbi:MAG TPA: ATP-binding protein [Sphingomicrobium sp.]|nr:ATP-binding protein [Sphingomicrobium sp.]